MEYKVYKTVVSVTYQDVDIDRCPIEVDKIVYENLFSSKKEAIRQAQKQFAKRKITTWSVVYRMTIGDKGILRGQSKRIYNLYKHKED